MIVWSKGFCRGGRGKSDIGVSGLAKYFLKDYNLLCDGGKGLVDNMTVY